MRRLDTWNIRAKLEYWQGGKCSGKFGHSYVSVTRVVYTVPSGSPQRGLRII